MLRLTITFFLLRFTELNSIVLKSYWIIFIVPKRIYSGGGGGQVAMMINYNLFFGLIWKFLRFKIDRYWNTITIVTFTPSVQ